MTSTNALITAILLRRSLRHASTQRLREGTAAATRTLDPTGFACVTAIYLTPCGGAKLYARIYESVRKVDNKIDQEDKGRVEQGCAHNNAVIAGQHAVHEP